MFFTKTPFYKVVISIIIISRGTCTGKERISSRLAYVIRRSGKTWPLFPRRSVCSVFVAGWDVQVRVCLWGSGCFYPIPGLYTWCFIHCLILPSWLNVWLLPFFTCSSNQCVDEEMPKMDCFGVVLPCHVLCCTVLIRN